MGTVGKEVEVGLWLIVIGECAVRSDKMRRCSHEKNRRLPSLIAAVLPSLASSRAVVMVKAAAGVCLAARGDSTGATSDTRRIELSKVDSLRAVEPFVSWLILTRQTARPPDRQDHNVARSAPLRRS